MKVLKNMPTDILVVESFYNNKISSSTIKKFKDNILFIEMDVKTAEFLIHKFDINRPKTFFDILNDQSSFNIINYYDIEYTVIPNCVYSTGDTHITPKIITCNNRLLWLDYYKKTVYNKFIYYNPINDWNVAR